MLTENAKLLETFANQFPERDYVINHYQPEFTSVCPKTGQPDFAKITLSYVANAKCVELKSYKFYLQSFRNHGIFYEMLVNTLLNDLVGVLEPRRMQVTAEFTPRGGIFSVVTAEFTQNSLSK